MVPEDISGGPGQHHLDTLQARYTAERERRAGSRSDLTEGADLQLGGALSEYLRDQHTPFQEREPISEPTEVLIIGAGMAGIMAAVALRRAGITRTRLVDPAGDVGGVWYWNRYPGCRCDVEALIYLPLLEELGTLPSERYATAAEILEHLQALARRFDLYNDALMHTAVTAIEWDESDCGWQVRTDRGDAFKAAYVVIANGPLSRPKLPDVPGIEQLSCRAFHTSRWDYAYTGGSAGEPMERLSDKVVGVVGTGATAIQCIPHLARDAKRLIVFQRTPSTIAPRNNGPVDAAEVASWEQGWQWRRVVNFTANLAGTAVSEDLVADGWTELYHSVLFRPEYRQLSPAQRDHALAQADAVRMDLIRARVDACVSDKRTAEALKPYYTYFCKRPCFHDEYLESFNRADVTLVDAPAGIERIDGAVVTAGGQQHAVDCLVFATGFEWNTPYVHKIGFDPVGFNGMRLGTKWENGISTLHGVATHGFPNLFIIPQPNSQSVVTENFAHSIQENTGHIAWIIAEVRRRGHRRVEVSEAGEQAWVETILARRRDDAAFLAECTPGRTNSEGRPGSRPSCNTNFGGTSLEFFELLARWRADGDFAGMTAT